MTDSITKHPDGHLMLDGAKWHRALTGNPKQCEVEGYPDDEVWKR